MASPEKQKGPAATADPIKTSAQRLLSRDGNCNAELRLAVLFEAGLSRLTLVLIRLTGWFKNQTFKATERRQRLERWYGH